MSEEFAEISGVASRSSSLERVENPCPALDDRWRDIIDKLFNRDYPDKKAVENVAKSVVEGRISDKEDLASQSLRAYRDNRTSSFQESVNKKLEEMKSPYKIKVDDTFAGIQDIGSISVDLIDKNNGKVVDSCGTAVDNSPRVPNPIDNDWLPPNHRPVDGDGPVKKDELPPDYPRLDIFDPPSKRK